MLKLAVVDVSAESRNRLIRKITSFLESEASQLDFVPRVNLQALSREEIRFNAAPDICLIGEEIVRADLAEIGTIRRAMPGAALLVDIGETNDLALIEQLARLGADDVMSDETGAGEFLRKIVLLSRRFRSVRSGKLLVLESGKGGLGVTSITASLGEMLAELGHKVALLDFDFETQDLSRFLQTRPFINENLQLLFDSQRPVTQEFVEQCLVRVWEERRLFCMPPVGNSEQLYDPRAACSHTLLSILEVLDSAFDYVLVDSASLRGGLLKALHRAADKVVLVVNSDPASLYASAEQAARIRETLPSLSDLLVFENASPFGGLSRAILRREFCLASGLDEVNWIAEALPFSRSASRWPASGETLLSCGGIKVRSAVRSVLVKAGLLEPEQKTKTFGGGILSLLRRGEKAASPAILPAPHMFDGGRLALPGTEIQFSKPKEEAGLVDVSVEEDLPGLVSGARVW